MARTSRSKAKKAVVNVNFEGVEASGKVSEGRHLLTVDGAPEVKTSEGSGNDYINWKFKAPGGVIYHTTSLQPQALWNLRNVLESLGLEVEESAMDLDLSEMDGLTCGGEVEHETYQGKKRPRLIDIFPAEELEEAEEDEEEAPKPAAKGKSKKAEPEPEPEEDDLTYAEVQEMDKDELVELAEENDIKLTVKHKKNLSVLRDHICAELNLEEEEEEDEEDEEETPPARNKRTARKASSSELKKGSKVTFVDDGDDMEGVVKSINTKDKFAVVEVEGEEWEVELADLTVA